MSVTNLADKQSVRDNVQVDHTNYVSKRLKEDPVALVFKPEMTDQNLNRHGNVHGIGNVQAVADGGDYPEGSIKEGDYLILVQNKFGNSLVLTEDYIDNNNIKAFEAAKRSVFGRMFDANSTAVIDALTKDGAYVDTFGNTVSYTTPQGVGMFSAAHTNSINAKTFSNIITSGVTLNPTYSVEAATNMIAEAKKRRDPVSGHLLHINLDTIITGPGLMTEVEQDINSDKVTTGGSYNNRNTPSVIKKLNHIVFDSFPDDFWMLVDSQMVTESIIWEFQTKPTMIYNGTENNGNESWRQKERFALGMKNPYYVFRSKGTNAA